MTRNKAALISLVLCMSALALNGAEPVAVPLRLDAADLVPGARYTLEARAYFGFFDPAVGRIDDAMLRDDFVEAPEVFRGSFVAPVKPQTTPKAVTFHLPAPPPAPEGMKGAVVFRINLEIAPPAGSAMKAVKKQQIVGGPLAGDKIVPHCFRVRGPVNGRYFYMGVADCAQPPAKMPGAFSKK
ncbi:MAG TPA: hypothetical protein VEK11_08830 [Thermoanaerobaculia bacterium]|nr:hypothetical protein [Thermoanaerobaculia bacterium]